MTRLSSYFSALLTAILVLISATGCDTVLQYPDGPPADPENEILVNVKVNDIFRILGEFEYDFSNNRAPLISRSKTLKAPYGAHQSRYVLKVYDSENKAAAPEACYTLVTTRNVLPIQDDIISLKLLPGTYKLVLWADYVDSGSELDKYYDTSEFSYIFLNNSDGHFGSNDYRDAFYGATTLKVPEESNQTITAEILLERPLAKYTFIANDFREFCENELLRRSAPSVGEPAWKPQLADYLVRVVYLRYMPSAFNAHTGKPADSSLGVEYYSPIAVRDEVSGQLAFDYVFTNGVETSVNVAMEVLYKDGTVVSRMPAFDVPLKRGHQTFITGKFLTTKSGGAIGINPDFSGNINIEIK